MGELSKIHFCVLQKSLEATDIFNAQGKKWDEALKAPQQMRGICYPPYVSLIGAPKALNAALVRGCCDWEHVMLAKF